MKKQNNKNNKLERLYDTNTYVYSQIVIVF